MGFSLAVYPLLLALAFPLIYIMWTNDPFTYLYPNLLLFTPFRKETIVAWTKVMKMDTTIKYGQAHVPVIEAADYTFEKLRIATENWRNPVVVRGLFSDAPAVKKWTEIGHLPSIIGEFEIPVVRNAIYGKLQNNRSMMTFGDAFTEIVLDEQSKLYMFFPVNSRTNFNGSTAGSTAELKRRIDQTVMDDLEIDKRIWSGFGTKAHKTFFGSQLIVGRGSNDSDLTTGTGWHCAGGNNWFVQVVGMKRWYFMAPKYSAYMAPLRGGKVNMMTGQIMEPFHDHIPLRYADLRGGDLLYNPDWEWHTIKNYEGLSIGVPIREVNISLSLRNNFHFTMIVVANKVLDFFKIDIGGYPPAQKSDKEQNWTNDEKTQTVVTAASA